MGPTAGRLPIAERFNIKSHGFSLLNYKYSRANSYAVKAPFRDSAHTWAAFSKGHTSCDMGTSVSGAYHL